MIANGFEQSHIMLLVYILPLLFASTLSVSSPPYWGTSSSIQTFQVTLVSSSTSGTINVPASYTTYMNRTFTAAPYYAAGCHYHDWYYVYYAFTFSATVTTTSITISSSFASSNYGFRMTVMLYTPELYPTMQTTISSYPSGSVGTVGSNSAVYNYTASYPSPVNISNNILIIPFLVGIYQVSFQGVTVKARVVDSALFQVSYNFRASGALSNNIVTLFLIIDRTKLQSTKTIYVDHYSLNMIDGLVLASKWATSYNSHHSATMIPATCNQTMIGMNSVWDTSTGPYYYYICGGSVTKPASTNTINITVTIFRVRICDPGTKFYKEEDNLCYDVCPVRNYADTTYLFCIACPYSCLQCEDTGLTAGVVCTACDTANDHRILINTTLINYTRAGLCQCNLGFFDTNLNATICSPCSITCLTCVNNSMLCTQCNGYRKLEVNRTCPCITGFEDLTSSANCTEKCGDGVKFILPCDDGNLVSGDGCSNLCAIEVNYTCSEITPSSPSVCVYNQPLTFTVTSTIVNNVTFSISITVSIVPVLPWMNTYNFSQLIVNDTDVNITSSTYSAGTLNLVVKYSNNSDGNTVAFTFSAPNNPAAKSIPSSNFTISIPLLIIPPTPIQIPAYLAIAAKLLIAMTIVNLIVYVIGGLKLAYVQTLWTLQISYFCLIGSWTIQPFQEVFKVLNIAANGYNRVIWNEINFNSISVELTRFGYNDQFVANFNVMLIIQIIIILISVVFYGLSKIKKWGKARKSLLAIHAFLLYDATLSFAMFNLLNSSFAMGLQIIIFIQQGLSSLFYINIIGICLSSGIILTSIGLFSFRANQFTNNVGMFKHDKASRFHPLVMLLVRFSMGFVMGILYRRWYSGIIVLAIQMGYGIYISIRNPYTLPFLLRAILNQGTILQNLLVGFLYQIHRINQEQKGGLVGLWIQIFLLGVSCLCSLFYMIYTIYVKIKNLKDRNRVNIEDQSGVVHGKKKRRVNLDGNLNETLEDFKDNIEVSEIVSNELESKGRNRRMKGVDY